MVDDEPPSLTLTPQLSQVATVAANLASALYYLRAVREDTRVQALRSERRQVHGERRQVHRAGARRVEEDLERAGGRERDIDHAATWLRGLPAELAQRVRADPAWPALAVRLHDVARAGHDPAAVLAHLAKVRGFDDAASVAQVLHWRIGRFIDGDTRFRAGFAADQPAEPAGPARPGAPTSPAAPASVLLQRVGRPQAMTGSSRRSWSTTARGARGRTRLRWPRAGPVRCARSTRAPSRPARAPTRPPPDPMRWRPRTPTSTSRACRRPPGSLPTPRRRLAAPAARGRLR